MDNLKYIRETMERATAFTGVRDGTGRIGIRLWPSPHLRANNVHLEIGCSLDCRAAIALLIAGWSMDRKARAAKCHCSRVREESRFSLSPPLSPADRDGGLYRAGLTDAIPGLWLFYVPACYGGMFSVSVVTDHGSMFHGFGRDRLLMPKRFANWFMRRFGGLLLFSE